MQKEHYRRITETALQEKQQRHDFRHHIAALRGLLEKGETHAAAAYLDALAAPSTVDNRPAVCRNETVNAVALYYLDMASRFGIADCSIRLEIPEDTGSVPAHVLCIVIGNLLENAVTACAGADAPFLLLDEPTSNLDSLNEAVILKSLREGQDGKTALLVSHRQSTMRIADAVYSIESLSRTGGRVS